MKKSFGSLCTFSLLLNTLLQQVDCRLRNWKNRFNGFTSRLDSTIQRFNGLTILRSFAVVFSVAFQRFNVLTLLTYLTLLTLSSFKAHANVYATNIRLNGGVTNIVAAAITNIGISYTLRSEEHTSELQSPYV